MQNFVRFHTIESEIELSQESNKKKNRIGMPVTEIHAPKLHNYYF